MNKIHTSPVSFVHIGVLVFSDVCVRDLLGISQRKTDRPGSGLIQKRARDRMTLTESE